MKSVAVVLWIGVVVPTLAAAQVRDRRVPDPSGAPQLNSGTISGRVEVISGRERLPVRRARMALHASGSNTDVAVYTDVEGRYRFERLTTGQYTLRVDKPGFVPSASDPPRTYERTLEIRPGSQIASNFLMDRGAAIEGRVVDELGRPLQKQSVMVVESAKSGLISDKDGYAITDDLGRFRIHTLPTGSYRVVTKDADGMRYFPGPRETDPGVLTLEAGRTIGDIEIMVRTVPVPPAADRAAGARPAGDLGGSGRIEGVVVRPNTDEPVAGAMVSLAAMASSRGASARADADGRFEFANLEPGTYVLVVSSGGLVIVDLATPRALTVTVKEGPPAIVRLIAPAPGSIEGRLVDEFGDPIPGADVRLLQRVFTAGRSRLMPREIGQKAGVTDDLGRFRVSDLPPADYWVEAVGTPFARVERNAPDVLKAGGFLPTFHPGTERQTSAEPIRIEDGTAVTGLVIPVRPSANGRLLARLVNANGTVVAGAQLMFIPRDGDDIDMGGAFTLPAAADGTIDASDIPAGDYLVQARGQNAFGWSFVTVRPGETSDPLAISMKAGRTLSGRIIREDGATELPPAFTLVVRPTDFIRGPIAPVPGRSNTRPDGHFEITGLMSTGVIRPILSGGWAVKSVKIHGEEVINTPFDFTVADIDDAEVTITNRLGAVGGTVTQNGKPAPNVAVLVFPEDPQLWSLPMRPVVTGRVDSGGAFKVVDILPGQYFAIASPPFAGELDPEWIASRRGLATPVVVTEKQTVTVALSLRR